MSTDITSRKYLDGRRKCTRESKFRLPPPEVAASTLDEDMTIFTVTEESLSSSLLSLQPKFNSPLRHKNGNPKLTSWQRESREIQSRLNGILVESAKMSGRAVLLAQLRDDDELLEFQEESVEAARNAKNGVKMTFPVLVRG